MANYGAWLHSWAHRHRSAAAEWRERGVLHEFLTSNRDEIVSRTQVKVAARAVPLATAALAPGIPLFLGQVIDMLRHGHASDEMNASATQHGSEMLRRGFTVAQVVHDYGNVCQAVTELAFERDAPITVEEFHTLSRCVDDAVAHAVTEYGRAREKSLSDLATERIGFFAHEMRNMLGTVVLSFDLLKHGGVAIGGRTGALLDRSLKGLSVLIDRSLAEIRLESVDQRRETIVVAEFIEQMEVAAVIEAKGRNLRVTVDPIDFDVTVEADRSLLAAAVSNLLQNAFKFTPENGSIRLRAHATSDDRVLIDVEDGCGGLPPGEVEALFRPFHQRGTDRSGLGLGLSISRRNAQINGGEVRARDVPGTGCVFTIDLPRSPNRVASTTRPRARTQSDQFRVSGAPEPA